MTQRVTQQGSARTGAAHLGDMNATAALLALDDADRETMIGSAFLAPTGDLYRLRSVRQRTPIRPEGSFDYSVLRVDAMSTASGSLPEDSLLVWAPAGAAVQP